MEYQFKVGDVLSPKRYGSLVRIKEVFDNTCFVSFSDLTDEIKIIEKSFLLANYNVPYKKWKAELCEVFYWIDSNLSVNDSSWTESEKYKTELIAVGNCFKTRLGAEVYAKKFKELLE